MKDCSKCGAERQGKDRSGYCKNCKAAYMKEYYRGKDWSPEGLLSRKKYRMLASAKKRARACSVPFGITADDINIPDRCPALGIELEVNSSILCESSPTLDRVIPERGYVPDNVAVISAKANRIKSNGGYEEILKVGIWLKTIMAEMEGKQ